MDVSELKKECDRLGIKYHHKAGEKKLLELLQNVKQESTETISEKPTFTREFIHTDGYLYRKIYNEKGDVLTTQKILPIV